MHSRVGVGVGEGWSGFLALKCLLDNETSSARSENGEARVATVVLVHIYPSVQWIVTPIGNKVPVAQVKGAIVEQYKAAKLKEIQETLDPYTSLCHEKQVNVEVCLIEADSVEKELVDQIIKLQLTVFVLGTSNANPFARALRGKSIPEYVVRHAPKFCTIMVVRRGRLFSMKEATEILSLMNLRVNDTNNIPDNSSEDGSNYGYGVLHPLDSDSFMYPASENDMHELQSEPGTPVHSLSINGVSYPRSASHIQADTQGPPDHEFIQNPRVEEVPLRDVQVPLSMADLLNNHLLEARHRIEMEVTEAIKIAQQIRESERKRGEALKQAELARVEDARRHEEAMVELEIKAAEERESLQQETQRELTARIDEYERVLAEERARFEESRIGLHELTARIDEHERKLAEERAKCEEAHEKLKHLTREYERESQLRKEAEERASVEYIAKDNALAALEKLQSSLRMLQRKYTNYSFAELQKATDNFTENNKLGEGGYGPVFKGKLQHMTVAIKLLAREGVHGRQEFRREVELLGHLHHPHVVMLLGACPEQGCIVYEYMANGSLADRLECKGGTPPLPWYLRFRICAEVATALLFLHSRPEPIVHRDIKPGNILLDHNFVSKVSDVGIAKLVPSDMTFSVTMYKETLMMGTPGYIDPDYQRTGVVSCESDVYAFGVVMLQILTGRQALGVAHLIEEAINNIKLHEVLDKAAGDWPLEETTKLARLALKCTENRRKDRPKLETEVLPTLDKLRVYADEEVTKKASLHDAEPIIPSLFLCPISQEIMENPCIAADGYTYERQIIERWLREHETSPMTNLKLAHKNVIPNYTVRSAIREWIDKTTPPNTR